MSQIQMRKRARETETGRGAVALELSGTVAAAAATSHNVQEKLGAWDIECSAPVADRAWMQGTRFRQAVPFSDTGLREVNAEWDEVLAQFLNARYVGARYTHERGLLLRGPLDSSDQDEYTEFALRICALLQQEAPRQNVGVIAESHAKYERFSKVYHSAYATENPDRGVGLTWLSAAQLESDFAATRLPENNFADVCEQALALVPEDHEGAPTEENWENARELLVDDVDARAQVLDDLRVLKEQACIGLFGEREVFDTEVPLPLARHPLLFSRSASNNFYSVRFDALVFLDAPRKFADFVCWNCLCGALRLVVGKGVGELGFMPYAQALAGMRVQNDTEFVLYGPLTYGAATPCVVNTDALSRSAMTRHNLWGHALFVPYQEQADSWNAWPAVRAFSRKVFGKKKKVRAAKRRLRLRKFPTRVPDIGSLFTVFCENMVAPSSADVREGFGSALAFDLQMRVQKEFARKQYYEMVSTFGHPDTWAEVGNTKQDRASWRDSTKLISALSMSITDAITMPLGALHVLRRISENDAGAPVLLLLPKMSATRHSTTPFRMSLHRIAHLHVTKELFDQPRLLIRKIEKRVEKEQPSCVLAYTPLALGCNPALTAIALNECGRQIPLIVLCQAGSLESVLMNTIMESIAGQLDDESTIDPASSSADRRCVFRRLCRIACRAFAIRVCADDLNGAHIPRSLIRSVLKSLVGDESQNSEDCGIEKVIQSEDASRDDLIRSATLCGFEGSANRRPTYDELAEYLQRVEQRTCYEQSPEIQSDMRSLPVSTSAWTFSKLAVASHRGVGVERILQHSKMPVRLTSGYLFRGRTVLLCAGRVAQTPWFGLPSSLTHELSRIAVHRSSFHRSEETRKRCASPWWSKDTNDSDQRTWEAFGNTVLRLATAGEDTSDNVYTERALSLQKTYIRRAVSAITERSPWATGEERLRRVNEACADWAAHACSDLRLRHAEFVLSEAQERRNARTFIRYEVERKQLIGLDMQGALEGIVDPHVPQSGRWFVRECVRQLRDSSKHEAGSACVVEEVPHELDLLLMREERAIDLVSVLMPGPQRQAQIGRRVRVPSSGKEDRALAAYENTLWFVTSSMEHTSPMMEMLYNYEIVLQKDAGRRIEHREESAEEQLAADTARALASGEYTHDRPARERRLAALRFQEIAAEATKAAEREARGEAAQTTITAEPISLRSGRLQRPSDFMNMRFLQTTGVIFGRKRMREVLERTMGSSEGADEAIQMLYERHGAAEDITFFTLADNEQRASYFERAKLTMVFRIMLNLVLDTGRPRLAPEFTEHALPLLKSGMLLGATAKTRKFVRRTLDDLISDLDACYYLTLPKEDQTTPEDPRYGDPERDPAFSARARRLALLCPRFMRVLIRHSIDEAVKRVRPTLEAHRAQMQASSSLANHTNL